jgi:hypothetical protein
MLGVLLRKVCPFLRHIILRKDSRYRARRNASAAVDALDWIDKQLIGRTVIGFVLLGVDAIDWTSVHTGGVLGADTGFCDYISHSDFSDRVEVSTLIVAHGPKA